MIGFQKVNFKELWINGQRVILVFDDGYNRCEIFERQKRCVFALYVYIELILSLIVLSYCLH